MLAGYGLLGKEAPAFVALPALPVTKDNLLDAWQTVYHAEAPTTIKRQHELTTRGRVRGRHSELPAGVRVLRLDWRSPMTKTSTSR